MVRWWLVGVVALLAVAGCGSSARSIVEAGPHSTSSKATHSRAGSPPLQTVVANPKVLAVAQSQSTYPPPTTSVDTPATAGSGPVLQIRSASTGKLIRNLATNVGSIAFSPDTSTVFYESTAGSLDPFPIDRIRTTDGRPVQVASGEDPAISPDGTKLAYATGDGHAIAIDDLAHHTTRTIQLGSLIGRDGSFNNTPSIITWLNDTQLVAFPPQDPTADASGSTTIAAPPGTCSADYNDAKQCAIVIDLAAAHPAHVVTPRLPRAFAITAAGPGPQSRSLLLGGAYGTVIRFAMTDRTATLRATVKVPGQVLIEGFSPSGHQVLYLRHHGPVQLWVGTVTTTGVTPARELLANVDLGSISW
jgi:hypothetical protein